MNSFILREHNIQSRLRNPIEKRALNSRILATLLDLSSRTLLAVLPSLSLSPSFQPMTKFSLSVGGRGRPCIIRRQSRSVGGARRGNAIDSIFNIKGAVTEGKLKQRVDRAQNGRGTFILSRRHWQGKQEDLLITFALQLRSLLSSLSPTLSLSPSPSFSPSLRSSSPFHIVECSRIRQHACDIPVPVGICLSFINANKAIIVDEWRGRLDIPLMARCRIRRGYPRSDVSMASNRSLLSFFFLTRHGTSHRPPSISGVENPPPLSRMG